MALINPTTLTAARNGSNKSYIDLSWTYTPNNGYRIYRADGGGDFSLVHTILPTVGYGAQGYGSSGYGQAEAVLVAWQDTTTTIAVAYQYRIHTYDVPNDAEIAVGTLSSVVAALDVAWVHAYRIRYDAGIDVSWEEVTGEDTYNIYRSDNGGVYELVEMAAADTSSWNDATANPLYVYRYKVTVSAFSAETSGTLSNTVNADACRAVSDVAAVKDELKITLTWTNVDVGDTLKVYRADDGGPMALLEALTPATTATYDDTTVELGHRYQYGVIQATTTGGGVLMYSNEESIAQMVSASWSRGPGSLNNEFFQVAKKVPEINATMSADFIPILIGGMTENDVLDYVPMIRDENAWVAIGDDTLSLTQDDSTLTRSKFYVYSVRARDARYNWSQRVVSSIQV